MLGLWQYENIIKIILKVCVYALSMVPALIIALIGRTFITSAVPQYLVVCLGVTLAGIGLSLWAPILA